ncbi:MAG: hypothetical protein ACK2TT_04800 [Anaerolineales bacterium]|jgi:hypothetical protein
MSKLISNRYRVLLLVILTLILATAAYGFAAQVDMSGVSVYAGEGQATVNGYVVSNLAFTLDGSDPRYFSSLTFDLDASANTVYLGLDDGADPVDSWITCSAGGTAITCDLTGYQVRPVDLIYVVAVQ